MVAYLLQVSLCWLIFYLLYYFWLSKETFFHLNRWYLLSTLVIGLLIPLLPSPFSSTVQESDWMTVYVAGFNHSLDMLEITVTAPAEVEESFDWAALLKFIYWGGVAFTGFRFLSGLWQIGRMYWRAEHIRVGDFKVALSDEAHLPFSFFRVIFKSKQGDFDAFEEEKITDHELAHVRGWHTIDVLMVELAGIFLWCSPLIYLYRRSLRMVHEYIADSAAIRTGQKKQYGHLLIRQSQSGLQFALANHFIHSQLKKRIVMMTKTRSRRQAFLKYLPVIPILVVALVVFSNWEAVANDPGHPLDNLKINLVDAITTTVAQDFDPEVLRKKLSAILYKVNVKSKESGANSLPPGAADIQLLRKFASTYEEWYDKYSKHQDEIKQITKEVAGAYDLYVEFEGPKMTAAYTKDGPTFRYIADDYKPGGKGFSYGTNQGVISTNSDDVITGKSEAGVKIKLQGEGEPYVLLNDKPAPADWKNQLDPEDIASVNVLKGESATSLYGEKGKDGVIQIYTKDHAALNKEEVKLGITGSPLYVVDGKIVGEEKATAIPADQIQSVNVLKGESATSLYGEKGKDGAVQIYTKDHAALNKEEVKLGVTGSPLYVVDGKIVGEEKAKAIPADQIQSVNVLKGGSATSLYGEKGKDGVVQISTKAALANTPQIAIKAGGADPLHILDGEIVTKEAVAALDPNDIEKIDVLKGEKAVAEYGDDGKDGVVRIFTKGRQYDRAPLFKDCSEVEKIAQEACSQRAFLEKVYRNIKYPASARNNNVQGMVVVKYTINEQGKLQNATILRGVDEALDKEVVRVISELPDWQPALKDGKPVAVEVVLPVKFKLEKDGESLPSDAPKVTDLHQSGKENPKVEDEVVVVGYGSQEAKRTAFKIVDEMPRFPGCEDETNTDTRNLCAQKHMLQFVYENVTYPKAAKDAGIEGMIVASFVVSKTGAVKDVHIERGLGYGLNEEVIQVLHNMPNWVPGQQDGKNVDVVVNLPVRFKLDSNKETKTEKKPTTVRVTGPETSPVANSLELRQFKAAPNPSKGQVNLRFQAEAAPLNVRIMSANGQVVYQQQLPQFSGNFDEQIDLSDAPKGTLFISVQQGEKIHSSTIILQ